MLKRVKLSKIMKSKKWIYMIVVILLMIILIIFFYQIISSIFMNQVSNVSDCDSEHNQIDKELKQSNFCEKDTDCEIMPLGGEYISFGCYHYINKDIDVESLYKKMNDYWEKCSRIVNDCSPAPESRCLNKKCVRVEK